EPLEPRQLMSAGSLDPTFAQQGVFAGAGFTAVDMARQSDGKIVLSGARDGDYALARLTENGALDPSFGGTGVVTLNLATHDDPGGVAIQPDGRIVIVGTAKAADFTPK